MWLKCVQTCVSGVCREPADRTDCTLTCSNKKKKAVCFFLCVLWTLKFLTLAQRDKSLSWALSPVHRHKTHQRQSFGSDSDLNTEHILSLLKSCDHLYICRTWGQMGNNLQIWISKSRDTVRHTPADNNSKGRDDFVTVSNWNCNYYSLESKEGRMNHLLMKYTKY